MMSKSELKKKSCTWAQPAVSLISLRHLDVFCNLLLTVTNMESIYFILIIMEKDRILALVMSPVHLPFNKSQVGTYQNTCIIQLKYHVTNNYSRGTC